MPLIRLGVQTIVVRMIMVQTIIAVQITAPLHVLVGVVMKDIIAAVIAERYARSVRLAKQRIIGAMDA